MDLNQEAPLSVLFSSPHGRQRREERHINRATLVLARRYGMKETDVRTGRFKYTYGGVVFIYDPIARIEITSYGSPDYASPIAGTRHCVPLFPRRKFGGPDAEASARRDHAVLRTRLFRDRATLWTSHTVVVVDVSGSMRIDDVDGARCRSDAVWLGLAKDHVERALQTRQATETDVMSVIVMGETSSIVLRGEPTDYVLFNTLLDFREWDVIKPEGPGHYRPALLAAANLLRQYDTQKQAVSLVFVSDGAPSDHKLEGSGGRGGRGSNVDADEETNQKNKGQVDFGAMMGDIAKEFGRRLSVTCIGMGNDDDDFNVLQDMVNEAQAYHANASFHRAGLHLSSLSHIFTCLSSFTFHSTIEMTRFGTNADAEQHRQQLTIRKDVVREKLDAPDDLALDDDDADGGGGGTWTVYNSRRDNSLSTKETKDEKNNRRHHGVVIRVWAWDRVKDDFVCLLDPRCVVCCDLVGDCCGPTTTATTSTATGTGTATTMAAVAEKGELCDQCQACFVCHECKTRPEYFHRIHSPAQCRQWLKQRRRGAIVTRPMVPSFSIAVKKAFFSEGVERMVAKTRFVDDATNAFIGKRMVAKQSRFVEEDCSYEARMDYHRQFLRTQAIASALATKFNAAAVKAVHPTKRMPIIRFLDPLVFELADANQQEVNQLVEEMLEVNRYEKFNNNMGFVRRDAHRGVICCPESGDSFPIYLTTTDSNKNGNSKYQHASLSARVQNLFLQNRRPAMGTLAAVPEAKESNDHNGESTTTTTTTTTTTSTTSSSSSSSSSSTDDVETVDPYEMIQAFSHFTYECSKQNLVVVDLQGTLVLDHQPPEVVLTDPAIHTRRRQTNQHKHHNPHLSRLNLGRTDRGDKGIASFFQTHECGPTCRRLGLTCRRNDATTADTDIIAADDDDDDDGIVNED